VPRSWRVRVPDVVADQGIRPGRLPFGTGRYYPVPGAALTGHGLPKAELACGASACTPVGQIIQPCADSVGQWRLAQCPHRKSSSVRSTRYDARTAGPHRSHVWLISTSRHLAARCRGPSRCYRRPPPVSGLRSSPSCQAFPPSSCAWTSLLAAYGQACRPTLALHRQIRYW
jgi:hypothetical protein